MNLSHNNQQVHCMSWRSTEMNNKEVNKLAKKVTPDWAFSNRVQSYNTAQAAVDLDELPPTIFNWKMHLGTWGHSQHWFIREVMPSQNSRPEPLTARLVAGFSPLEVRVEVNNLISVDTVAQTFTADVMWEVALPGITAIREDSAIQELLQILEIDGGEFEFTNVNSTQDVGDVYYCLAPAGTVRFTDPTSFPESTTEFLSHVQISRRIVATFNEEMTVYNFPVDQQKLTFSFSTGHGVSESLRITPAPVDAGTFAITNYKMGNVYDVVYHDKVFVGEIDAKGVKKGIRFEMMLERRPGYYMTNVATPAGIITYLCFISYTTLSDGMLLATGDRLQIVLTLLLTAVTFKYQVASLTPQISYFTTLDKYVFFCFIVACVVVIENALFPVVARFFSEENNWQEKSLLWVSIGFFTLVNIVWSIHITIFVKIRTRASNALLQVHEVIRVIATSSIPAEHREAVLHEYLDECHYYNWELPKICCAEFGYLYVQLPDDEPRETADVNKKQKLHASTRLKAEQKLDALKDIYTKLNPTVAPLRAMNQESQVPLRAAKPSESFKDGRNHILRRTPTSPAVNTVKRAYSEAVYHRI
ncbi:putative membrane protein [Phytophthora megakarya]|uniref:Putative membrane protein n=1 Tax=Phytophthora megakarya TaxID=4795 RepID=A0A225X465_9STRA|nr:putative membrane protein [Phytophthora megakarya]